MSEFLSVALIDRQEIGSHVFASEAVHKRPVRVGGGGVNHFLPVAAATVRRDTCALTILRVAWSMTPWKGERQARCKGLESAYEELQQIEFEPPPLTERT